MPAHVEFGEVMMAGAPVYPRLPRKAEIVASASSTQTSFTANGGEFATVTAIAADVNVAIGSNPTALAAGTNQARIPVGVTRDFGPLKDGDKVAVIDAT